MSIKNTAKFALGAVLFVPLFATEDVLRHFNAPISKHGLFKNDEGKGILEIWNEVAPEPKLTEKEIKNLTDAVPSLEGFIIPAGF